MTVSVIVATHGAERWKQLALDRAVPSTVGQGADEVIVVHDAAASLAQVRNAAASAATGDWLCFLDADDELAPGYIDAMRRVLSLSRARRPSITASSVPTGGEASGVGNDPGTGAALLVPAVSYVSPSWRVSKPVIPNGGGRRPLHEINCCCIGTMVLREMFLAVGGFDPRWRVYEDWALWLACARAGARIVPVPGAVYRAHTDGGGRNRPDRNVQRVEYWAIRREHELLAA